MTTSLSSIITWGAGAVDSDGIKAGAPPGHRAAWTCVWLEVTPAPTVTDPAHIHPDDLLTVENANITQLIAELDDFINAYGFDLRESHWQLAEHQAEAQRIKALLEGAGGSTWLEDARRFLRGASPFLNPRDWIMSVRFTSRRGKRRHSERQYHPLDTGPAGCNLKGLN